MKRVFNLFFVFLCLSLLLIRANALTFEEGFEQTSKTPMAVIIYAQWADGYQNCINQFKSIQSKFVKKYNFVELDIASKDAKAFNDRYHIYPKLPYMLIYRDNGRVSRYIPRECVLDESCLTTKLKVFIQ